MGGIVGLLGAGLLAAGPALAHPHVWIDTRIEVILDAENQATGLRISWTYDDLYSLYIIGDKGLDPDWDGALTPEAAAEARRARDATAELARLVLERAGINRAPSAAQKDDVSLWRNGWHMDPELLLLAADASNGLAQPYANIKKLLASWHGANISTLAAAGADLEKKGQAAERRDAVRRSRALGHSQRKYSDEELKRIGIDLLDN